MMEQDGEWSESKILKGRLLNLADVTLSNQEPDHSVEVLHSLNSNHIVQAMEDSGIELVFVGGSIFAQANFLLD